MGNTNSVIASDSKQKSFKQKLKAKHQKIITVIKEFQKCHTKSKELKSFHLFRQLPPELQFQIYEYTLPNRVLHVGIMDEDAWLDRSRILAPTPALLHVSHETRAFALTKYTLSFRRRCTFPFYFSIKDDILFFPTEREFIAFAGETNHHFVVAGARPIERMGLNVVIRCHPLRQDYSEVTINILKRFRNIKVGVQAVVPFPLAQVEQRYKKHFENIIEHLLPDQIKEIEDRREPDKYFLRRSGSTWL